MRISEKFLKFVIITNVIFLLIWTVSVFAHLFLIQLIVSIISICFFIYVFIYSFFIMLTKKKKIKEKQ